MQKTLLIFCHLIVLLETSFASHSPWLDYMVTVEQPVTLVTNTLARRSNGTCCTDCTICLDDPTAEFSLFVCIRPGFDFPPLGIGDTSYCPLGRADFTPNSPPGPQSALTPRPEAATLERQYRGVVQLYMTITAIVDDEEVFLDDVWVVGFVLPADGIFRRITSLSFTEIAIVGVKLRVQCTNGAETDDCSVPAETTEEIQSTSQDIATTAATDNPTTDQDSTLEDTTTDSVSTGTTIETTAATTVAQSDTPATTAAAVDTQLGNTQDSSDSAMPQGGSGASSSKLSPVSIVTGLCIGAVIATAITVLVFSLIAWYLRRNYKMYPTDPLSTSEMNMSENPVYIKNTTMKGTEDPWKTIEITKSDNIIMKNPLSHPSQPPLPPLPRYQESTSELPMPVLTNSNAIEEAEESLYEIP